MPDVVYLVFFKSTRFEWIFDTMWNDYDDAYSYAIREFPHFEFYIGEYRLYGQAL